MAIPTLEQKLAWLKPTPLTDAETGVHARARPRRVRDRLPAHQRHPRRGHGRVRPVLPQRHGDRRRLAGRHLHRRRRHGERLARDLPARRDPAPGHQVHPAQLHRQPGHQRRRPVVRQRRGLRRDPQPRPARGHAGVLPGRADRLDRGPGPHHRDRRLRARRHADRGDRPLRGGTQPPPDQDRRQLPAPRRHRHAVRGLRDPRAADGRGRPQGPLHGRRPGPPSAGRVLRPRGRRLRQDAVPAHARGRRAGRPQPDPHLGRRDLPLRHLRRRRRAPAGPGPLLLHDARQEGRPPDGRLHRHRPGDGVVLQRPPPGRHRALRQLRLRVPVPRPADRQRDLRPDRLRLRAGHLPVSRRARRHQQLGDDRHRRDERGAQHLRQGGVLDRALAPGGRLDGQRRQRDRARRPVAVERAVRRHARLLRSTPRGRGRCPPWTA